MKSKNIIHNSICYFYQFSWNDTTVPILQDIVNGVMGAINKIEVVLRRNNGKNKSYFIINYFDLVRVRDHP